MGLGLAVLAAFAISGAGLGFRWNWWGLGDAFGILKWGMFGGIAAVLLSLAGMGLCWRRRHSFAWALAGLVVSAVATAVPGSFILTARQVPPIHDITTDTVNPPQFAAILARRADAPNSPTHGGAAIAEQQKRAYPDIAPILLAAPPAQAFDDALAVARGMGWTIVAADARAGRIEASDTTLWFAFTDDIVIRVTACPTGANTNASRIDIRSVSRLGRSDLGANARRIRRFTSNFQRRAAARAC